MGGSIMSENDKGYKYIGMAEIIYDYLMTFKDKQTVVRLTAKDARKLDGMDKYANNTCYNNVARAMEYVAEHYVYGKQVQGTEKGKGNSTYAFDYELDKNNDINGFIIDEIRNKMEYIEEITSVLGEKLNKEDYYIEDMGRPHKQPSKLPQGYSAIYIFVYESETEYRFLKICKANEKSSARFSSQHYGFSAPSTLAKSICSDEEFIQLGINKNNVKEWMLENLHRINICVKANKATTELVEAVFHYAFRPKYEGNL